MSQNKKYTHHFFGWTTFGHQRPPRTSKMQMFLANQKSSQNFKSPVEMVLLEMLL
jgi:hypothetical protein